MQNLKSKYEQKEMRVSDGLWDRLEQKLDQAPVKEQKSKMIWLRYAAVILLMIGLGGILWMTNQKTDVKKNQQLARQIKKKNPTQQSEDSEMGNQIPIATISDDQKPAIETVKYSESIKKENQNANTVSEKEILIKNEEPKIITQPEEKLAQNEIPKPKVKYVSSSDLLFGVEIDKAKAERPKSAMGINISKPGNDLDNLNPKRIKIFGITLYDKDSITTK